MTNKQIIAKFVQGATKGQNSGRSLFIEGDTLYSYGYHFKAARHGSGCNRPSGFLFRGVTW